MPTRRTPPADLIPCIGYIRVSMLQEEQISPDIQRHAIDGWAQRTGRRIVRWIEDLDVSGRTFARKIMDGIEAIEAGEAKEIAVWKFSRFGRNRTGCAVNLGRINLAGGELQSATEEVDATTAVGRLTRGVLMELAAFESDRAGEQWAEAWANRHARGLPSHGGARFGYVLRGRERDPLHPRRTVRAPQDGEERYEIDENAGSVLADLYRRYTTGEGGQVLAAWLNNHGFRTTRGELWSSWAVLRTLDSGFGAGLLAVHDINCECRRPSRCTRHMHIAGTHPAVISHGEWDAYRRRRRRVADLPPRARSSVYPLSGRIRCGHCGASKTVVGTVKPHGGWYRCNAWCKKGLCKPRTVRRVLIEDAVLAALAEWADDIERLPQAESAPIDEPVADLSLIEAEIGKIDDALVRLTGQLARGLVPESVYARTRDDLLADRAKAAAQLRDVDLTDPSPHDFVPVIRTLIEEWDTWAAMHRREVIAEIVTEIRSFHEGRGATWIEIEAVWGGVRTVHV